jgi:hypothetical protein
MAPKRPKRPRDLNQWAWRMVDLATGTLILASLIAAVPASVLAEAKVEGNPDAVRVEARDATVDEVLSAMGTAFNLRYRTSTALDLPITGIYEGSLPRVISRVLEGYNFIVKDSPGNIEVVVITRKAVGTTAQQNPAAAVSIPPASSSDPPFIPQSTPKNGESDGL